MTDIEFAERFSSVVHHGQQYGTHPYTYHLEHVVMILNQFGFLLEKHLHIAAWLHDVIEDTNISYNQIRFGFGNDVADIVYAVTNEMGRNRKERYAKTYPKIKTNKDALIIKLADRIANIEFSKGANTNFVNMYQKEWDTFKRELYDSDESDKRVCKMWKYLESLFDGDENVK